MQTLLRFAGVPLGYLVCTALRVTGLRAGLAVMYHRVGEPPGDYASELVPKLATRAFEAQVRHLRRTFGLVPASELPDAVAARRRFQRFPAAITFDDDDPGHAAVSAPILRRHHAPGTFFLSGAALSAPFRFWWEVLQLAVDRGVADERVLAGTVPADAPSTRELALSVQLLPSPEREALVGRLEQAVGPAPPDAGMRLAQVRELADAGFEIGFHTRRHEYLVLLDEEALVRAMWDGRAELEQAAGRPLEAIAYPHGGAEAREADAARAAEFRTGYTTQPVVVTPASDRLRLGRVEGSFRSPGHFALRAARPFLREVKRTRGR